MSYFEVVGQNILNGLEEVRMERRELSEKLGVSRQMLQKILKGHKAINVMEISRIAGILGVPADFLLREPETTSSVFPVPAEQYMGSSSERGSVGFIQNFFDEYVKLEDRHHESERSDKPQ